MAPFVEIRISTSRNRGINKRVPAAKNALKPVVFLGGNKFHLRIPVGKRFVSQALPLHENHFVCSLKGRRMASFSFEKSLHLS